MIGLLSWLSGFGKAHLFVDSFYREGDTFERVPICRIAALLKGEMPHNAPWKRFMIIDSRSKLEYAGGHIRGAINCQHDWDKVQRLYSKLYSPDLLFVFHCEFSQYRGPTSVQTMINLHQQSNRRSEPLHIAVMDGGYASFYPWFRELCDGTYWPEVRLDPSRPEDKEFLKLAHEFVASHPSSKEEF